MLPSPEMCDSPEKVFKLGLELPGSLFGWSQDKEVL
jgi:hypothetical protein